MLPTRNVGKGDMRIFITLLWVWNDYKRKDKNKQNKQNVSLNVWKFHWLPLPSE